MLPLQYFPSIKLHQMKPHGLHNFSDRTIWQLSWSKMPRHRFFTTSSCRNWLGAIETNTIMETIQCGHAKEETKWDNKFGCITSNRLESNYSKHDENILDQSLNWSNKNNYDKVPENTIPIIQPYARRRKHAVNALIDRTRQGTQPV